jgi:hypothetical protein
MFPRSTWKLIKRYSSFLFVATIVIAFLVIMSEAPPQHEEEYLRFSTVTGYFLQDDPETDPNGFDYVRYRALVL